MDPSVIVIAVAGVVGGTVAAVAGFGIGSLLTPVLAVETGTKVAVALVALPHLVATASRLWLLRRHVDRVVLRTFGLASAGGGLVGALLHAATSSPVLAVILGILLVVAGVSALFDAGARLALHGRWAIVGGILSGAFGGLVGNQGGIRSAALLPYRLEGTAFVATATASALLVDLVRVPVYLMSSGREIAEARPLVALMTVAVLVGTFAGAPILRRMPEPVFRRVVAGLIVALGLGLIAGIAG